MAKIILFNFEAGAAKKTGIAETLSKKGPGELISFAPYAGEAADQEKAAGPESIDWLIVTGHALYKNKHSEEAKGYYRRALEIDSDSPVANYGLARCLHAEWQHAEAEKFYLKTLGVSPNYADAHESLGRLYLETGRPGSAIKHFCLCLNGTDGDSGERRTRARRQIELLKKRYLQISPGAGPTGPD